MEKKPHTAEYFRQRRAMQREATNRVLREREEDSIALLEVIKRGRELTEMMRTPTCMWQQEWLK